jgi:hypothetical protein
MMVPAWLLGIALLAGAAAGWYLRGRLGRRPAAGRPGVPPPEPEPAAEPALQMEAVLSELERRYQGRVAEPEMAKPKAPRRPRPPKT